MIMARSLSMPAKPSFASRACASRQWMAFGSVGASWPPATTMTFTPARLGERIGNGRGELVLRDDRRGAAVLQDVAELFRLGRRLTGENTAPAFSVAKIATTASAQLSMKTTTRSPRFTPFATSVAARRSEARSTSLKVGRTFPATSAVLPGERLALDRRNSSTRMVEPLSLRCSRGNRRFEFSLEIGGNRCDRIRDCPARSPRRSSGSKNPIPGMRQAPGCRSNPSRRSRAASWNRRDRRGQSGRENSPR